MSPLRKWLVIAVAVTTTIVTWGAVLSAFPLISLDWGKDFSASHGVIMMALTLSPLGQGALSPLAGYAVGKLSVRNLLLIGLALSAAGLALVAVSNAMWQVLVVYAILLAAGTVLTGPLITSVLAVRLFSESKGLATGIVTMGVGLSAVVMPPVVKLLLGGGDWRMALVEIALFIALVLAPIVFVLVGEARPSGEDAAAKPAAEPTLTMGQIARDRVFWGLSLAFMPLAFMFNGLYFNVGFSLADQGGTAGQAAAVLTAGGMASLPGMLLFGGLADRVRPLPLFIVTVVGMAAMATVSALTGSYNVLIVSVPAWTFFQGGAMTLIPVNFATRFGAANFARANGLGMALSSVMISGAAVAGYGRDALGSAGTAS